MANVKPAPGPLTIDPGPPPPALNGIVLEEPGSIVKVTGEVVDFYQDGAIVMVPMVGGSASGIPTRLKGLKLGELVTLEATVIEATRDRVSVSFAVQGGEQLVGLYRFGTKIESKP